MKNGYLHKKMSRIHLNFIKLPWDVLHKAKQRLSDIIGYVNLIAEAPGLNVDDRDTGVYQPEVEVHRVDYLKGIAHHLIDSCVVPGFEL